MLLLGVSVFAGSYFETDPPVRFLTVSRGSNACSVGETQCSGPNSVQYCDSTNGYGCNVWGTVSDCPTGVAGTCLVYDGCSGGSCTTNKASAGTSCSNGDNKYCNGVYSGNAGCAWECISDSDCQEGYQCSTDHVCVRSSS